MRIALVALLCATVVAGCAKDADQVGATYTSPVLYETYTCPQLAEEAQRVSSHAPQASVARSPIFFENMAVATKEGKKALAQLLAKPKHWA